MARSTTLPTLLSTTLAQRLDETLLALCAIPSPIGEEQRICDVVEARLRKLPNLGTLMRIGDSLVAPLAPGSPGPLRRPRIALVGHLDTVRTENGEARIGEG